MARAQKKKRQPPPEPKRGFPWKGLVIAVVIVGGIGALVALDPPPPGIVFPDQGNLHLDTPADPHVPYNSSPPSSGPHFGGLANWGVSEEPIPPEIFVHNLEDGGIVVGYDCPEGCDDFRSGLAEFVESEGGRLLMTPYSGIVDPDGVARKGAVVAWTRVFYFDQLTDDILDEIRTFVTLFEGVDHHVGAN